VVSVDRLCFVVAPTFRPSAGKCTLCSGFAYGSWLTYYYAYMLCMSGMIDMMEITTSIIAAIVHVAAPESGWANEYDTCMCDHETSKFDYVGKPVLAPVFPLVVTLVVFFGVAFALDFKLFAVLA